MRQVTKLKLDELAFYTLGHPWRACAGPGGDRDQWDGPACHRQVTKSKARTAALEEAGSTGDHLGCRDYEKGDARVKKPEGQQHRAWWHTPLIPVLGSQADLCKPRPAWSTKQVPEELCLGETLSQKQQNKTERIPAEAF